MKKHALALVLLSSLSGTAAAGEPFDALHQGASWTSGRDHGYFPGIGSPNRAWEFRFDTAYATSRVFAERVDVGYAFSITNLVKIVARASFGATTDTKTGLYLIQGPLPSLGLRLVSQSGDFWLEVGARALIPFPGPHDKDTSALVLARDATLVNPIADDAAWLPFSAFALQYYFMVETRFRLIRNEHRAPLMLGGHYGGRASSAEVTSWLGPQRGYIGNAFAEIYLMFPELPIGGLQVGSRVDVSLSAVWPGSQAFPTCIGGFVGWSPLDWLSLRAYLAAALPLTAPELVTMPYGLRLQVFLP